MKKQHYNDDLNNQMIVNDLNNHLIQNNLSNNQFINNDINNQLINNNLNNQLIHDDSNNIYDLLYNIYIIEKNYDGVNELYRKAKEKNKNIKISDVRQFLKSQNSYQRTFKPIKKNTFAPIYSEKPYSFQIDLTFIPQYKHENKGYYVLFTAININTRFAYASYASNKNTDTIIKLFQHFQNQTPDINYIMGDLGSEFTNKKFISYLESNNIEYDFFKSDSHKLGIINRFHRTLKEKILKYMLANDTTVWYNVLDDIINNYNNSYHRGIKMKPLDVNNYFEMIIINDKRDMYENFHSKQPTYQVNDIIRVKTQKNNFDNKMIPLYSNETYKITKVNKNTVMCIDLQNNEYTFKKNKILVVSPHEFKPNNDIMQQNKKTNNIIRKIKHEDLINEPTTTQLRTNRTKNKKYNNDYIT